MGDHFIRFFSFTLIFTQIFKEILKEWFCNLRFVKSILGLTFFLQQFSHECSQRTDNKKFEGKNTFLIILCHRKISMTCSFNSCFYLLFTMIVCLLGRTEQIYWIRYIHTYLNVSSILANVLLVKKICKNFSWKKIKIEKAIGRSFIEAKFHLLKVFLS